MSSYTDVFGGNPVNTAEAPYRLFNLNVDNQNITLNWPSDLFDTNDTTAYFINVNCTAVGTSLTLPDTTLASVGQNFIIYNSGNQAVELQYNDGTQLLNINNGQAYFFELIDNSTANGQWLYASWAAFQGVTSVAATAPNRGFTIGGSPIVNNGTLVFALANMLAALEALAATGNQGLIVQIGDSNITVRSIVPGNNNIEINNQTGAGGNITISLSQNLVGLISALIGNLSLSGNTITVTNENGNVILTANGNGYVQSTSPFQLTAGRALVFNNADNTFSISLRNVGAIANLIFNLPIAMGADNAIMQTSAQGQLSFSPLTTVIANQLQMQAGTSQVNPVTPSNLVYGQGSCKAWVIFDGTAEALTILNSYNVAYISLVGTGVYTVTTNVLFAGKACAVVNAYTYPVNNNPQNLAAAVVAQNNGNSFTIYLAAWNSNNFANFNTVCLSIDGTLQ